MHDIDEALGRVAEAIRSRGAVPEDVIVGLESLRRSVIGWLAPSPGELVMPEHGRWLVSPSGARLDLASRRTLRRLVVALVEERIARPGQALSPAALVDAGWPGESVAEEVSMNRLRVALTRLRRAGLHDVLVRTETGWMLKPTVPIVRGGFEGSDEDVVRSGDGRHAFVPT